MYVYYKACGGVVVCEEETPLTNRENDGIGGAFVFGLVVTPKKRV